MTPTIAPPVADQPQRVLDPEDLPDLDQFVTEDGKPVDNMYVEKLQRLLTEPLYSSWPGPGENRTFLALANVGLFFSATEPPLVPDMMLSLDVPAKLHPHTKEHRSYFTWIMGGVPDVAIEIVSDLRGEEEGEKMRTYARLNIPYYVIYDPDEVLRHGVLRTFERSGKRYKAIPACEFDDIGLGLKLWDGEYEGHHDTWVRWCDLNGNLVPTGKERADDEKRRADDEQRRADDEQRRADDEKHRADDEQRRAAAKEARILRLEAQLQELGQEPRNGELS